MDQLYVVLGLVLCGRQLQLERLRATTSSDGTQTTIWLRDCPPSATPPQLLEFCCASDASFQPDLSKSPTPKKSSLCHKSMMLLRAVARFCLPLRKRPCCV